MMPWIPQPIMEFLGRHPLGWATLAAFVILGVAALGLDRLIRAFENYMIQLSKRAHEKEKP